MHVFAIRPIGIHYAYCSVASTEPGSAQSRRKFKTFFNDWGTFKRKPHQDFRYRTKLLDDNNNLINRPLLEGLTVMNLFFENSTRTRTTFEAAAKRLSANVLNIDIARSSTSKVKLCAIRSGTLKQWQRISLLFAIHLRVLHISLLKMYVQRSRLLMQGMDVMLIRRKRCLICLLFAVKLKTIWRFKRCYYRGH